MTNPATARGGLETRPPFGGVLATILAAAAALIVAAPALAQGAIASQRSPAQEPPPSSANVALNPIALRVPLAPQAIAASDRRTHLTYEVLATNTSANTLRVQSITVRSGDGGRNLLKYEGDAVAAHMSLISDWTKPVATLAPSATATLWIDVALDAGAALPAELLTRVTVAAEGTEATPITAPATDVRTAIDPRPVRVLQPPLSGALWGVIEACCDESNHHRRGQRSVDGHLRLPERYAIDFVQFDRDANLYRGDNINRNYFGFGQPVLAVADATVVSVHDQYPDTAPGAPLPPPTLPAAGGNHVVLDLGGGAWAMYGHLQHGSVKVRAGERVHAGQVLARLGNNGNSDLAHLHFQLMDSRNFALAEGLPFVFDRYQLAGHTEPKADRIVLEPTPQERRDQLPLSTSIVNFPAPAKANPD